MTDEKTDEKGADAKAQTPTATGDAPTSKGEAPPKKRQKVPRTKEALDRENRIKLARSGCPICKEPPADLPAPDTLLTKKKDLKKQISRLRKKKLRTKKNEKDLRIFLGMKKVITNEYTVLSILGGLIGAISALAAWLFRAMIDFFRGTFLGVRGYLVVTKITDMPYGYWTVIMPALGGLIVGLLIYYLAPEVGGHGTAAVMEAVAVRGGKMRHRVIGAQTLSSSICIGSGGSVGREGPIVQISGAIGSALAQWFRFPESWTKILVACGATGAITASFNTPIAAVIFALELILIEFKTRSFIPLVVSAVSSKILTIQLLGDQPAFDLSQDLIDTYVLKSGWELGIYLLLGVLAGVVAILFIKTLTSLKTVFEKIKCKLYLKTTIGGLLVGLIALAFPQVLGVGYETVDIVLKGNVTMIPFYLLFTLIFVKIIATCLSLGSGSSGGVFSPSLFIGAMLGGAVGNLANTVFPALTGPQGAYAVVGMAALFAGVSRATFTSIIIVFEMTLDYQLILPVMFACVVADAVASVLMKETIFTVDLARKGIRIIHDMEVNILEAMTVKEAMVQSSDVYCVPENMSIGEVYSLILKTEHMGFPIKDEKGYCSGIITFHDVDRAISKGHIADPAKWYCTRKIYTTYPDEPLEKALLLMDHHNISHLPVVSRKDKRILLGFISKGDLLRVYAKRQERDDAPDNWIPWWTKTK